MHRGYIKIWRKLEDSGLLQMHGTFCLFIHMLLKACHKDIRVGMTDLKRGQLISGRHQLAEAVGLSEQQLRTCEKRLHSLNMIQSKSTNKFTIYTIVNYEIYQDSQEQDNKQQTNKKQTKNKQLTTIQEANNLIIEEEDIPPKFSPPIPDDLLNEWMAVRKKKRSGEVTERVWGGIVRESSIAGISTERAIEICCEKGWASFDASWKRGSNDKQDSLKRTGDLLTGRVRDNDQFTIDVD